MNNDIRKLIDDNWEDIKELIAQKAEVEQKPKTIWDLKKEDGEEYHRLYSDGDVTKLSFDSYYDEKSRKAGNAFLTEEEAKFEAERREIEAIMRKYSRPFKSGEFNCMVKYDTDNNMVSTSVAQFHDLGVPVFESNEVAAKAIDEIGEDRLIKYWFGVAK